MPQRRGYLERLEGAGRTPVSKHPLQFERQRQWLGRDYDEVVPLKSPGVARKHAMLEWGPLGRWWLVDLGTTPGVWINRAWYRSARRMLEPNDIIRFSSGPRWPDLVFRFGVEGWVQADAAMRAAIDEAPSDAGRWEVWADFLEEQGDPLADRIRGTGPSPGDLGVGSGHGWEHGFIARGVLQRGGRMVADVATELSLLLGSPFSRWMRSLHVDLASYVTPVSPYGPVSEEAEALKVLELLTEERPQALAVLSFQLARRLKSQKIPEAFSTLRQALPKLHFDLEALLPR
jgi:hypothetical protein